MKKEILQTVSGFLRSAFAGTMVVCALMLTSLPMAADAQTLPPAGINPEIKYLGTVEGKLVFQIELKSISDEPLFVSIKDNEGMVLFTERIRDNQFSRKFAFDQEEFGGQKLSFVINDANHQTSQAFQVARSTRMVENVVITKL